MFLHGLADRIQNKIYVLELRTALDDLIDLAIRVDAQLQHRDQRAQRSLVPVVDDLSSSVAIDTVGPSFNPEPMLVGRACLSQEEKEQRRTQGLCLYFGAAGHIAAKCPVKVKPRQ